MSQSFPPQEPSSAVNSTRSSFTYLDPPQSPSENGQQRLGPHGLRIAEIAARGEEEFEHYGGDDIHEPPPKPPAIGGAGLPSVQTIDANMVTWDGPDDPTNPQNWTVRYKWAVTFVIIVMTVNVTFASSAPSVASHKILTQFHIEKEVSYLVTTTFLLGYVFGPSFWGPGSELVGRKPIFVISMLAYTLFILGQALAPNIETLLVTRFFSGFFAVAPLTNSGGVIADIWPAVGRGPAMTLFTASVFLGPVLGPIIAGFIIQSSVTWRWVFWVMLIFAGVCSIVMFIFMPETYSPIILQKKVKRLRKEDPVGSKHLYCEHEKQDWSYMGVIRRTLFRPAKMLVLEPILLLITIYTAVVYGLLYALFQAFPIVFVTRRGFTISQNGLIFIGVGIGTTVGSIINHLTTRHYPALIKKWKGFPPPENRLYGAMVGSPALVVGIFWFGWTGEFSTVPWYVPAISTIFVGAGIGLIFMSFLSYLVDTYLMYSASAFAANTAVRSAVAAAFPLFTTQMFTNIGVHWACTIIGLIGLLFVPSPFLFYKYGARIRAHSKFAPCLDLQIAAEMKLEKEEQEMKGMSTEKERMGLSSA
ncbi:hypothetical protein M413DRAFT_447793 [Hebeloma cylindrosporum]|uniref:Major facilitator superfamily (MFS) profile domain-containing protein n=1 Tax=Hebeloma cylindrosporum TaxID=76867 RepID=A0A0C2YCA1_HEBCY|nr:hypothetical protein M413DRAFT_447793 [Hebeloma cylindrosporum h7]